MDTISKYQDVFHRASIEAEITKAKKREDQKRKSEGNQQKKMKEIETYLKNHIAIKEFIITDFNLYEEIPNDSAGIITNLKKTLHLKTVRNNNNVSNKICG